MTIAPGALSANVQLFGPQGSDTTMIDNYIPEIWSGKLLEKFYNTTVFGEISNTDYEGEIKSHGDTVHIRIVPDITINDYDVNQSLSYERPAVSMVDLTIDQGKYFAVSVNKVEEKQADINYVSAWATDASAQMKISIDTDVLSLFKKQADGTTDILGTSAATKLIGVATGHAVQGSGVSEYNQGTTAGYVSGSVDLGVLNTTAAGTASTAIGVTSANIIQKLVEMGQVLDEHNCPEEGRWVVLPAWACALIKQSDLKDASLSGDGSSILRNGRVGMIDRFTIYMSNQVPTVTNSGSATTETVYCMPFGHKRALTFASQLVENEVIPNPDDFGQLMRGLQVYGRKIINGQHVGVLQGYKA